MALERVYGSNGGEVYLLPEREAGRNRMPEDAAIALAAAGNPARGQIPRRSTGKRTRFLQGGQGMADEAV